MLSAYSHCHFRWRGFKQKCKHNVHLVAWWCGHTQLISEFKTINTSNTPFIPYKFFPSISSCCRMNHYIFLLYLYLYLVVCLQSQLSWLIHCLTWQGKKVLYCVCFVHLITSSRLLSVVINVILLFSSWSYINNIYEQKQSVLLRNLW